MKAIAVKGPGQVELVSDVPKPVPREYEALVEVHYCGFCNGTDFQIINGLMSEKEGMRPYPTILGHEGAGVVVELGSKVRYIDIGQKFIHPNLRKDAGAGYSKTYGGFAEYGLVADRKALAEDGFSPHRYGEDYLRFERIPDDFDLQDAAIMAPLCEALSAVKYFGVDDEKSVLIYGAGPMGTLAAKYAKLLKCPDLTVVDMDQNRLERAQRISGVDRILNNARVSVGEYLHDKRFDIVIDLVGHTNILLEGSQFLKPFGKLCAMGVLKMGDEMLNVTHLQNNTMLHMLNFPHDEYSFIPEVCAYVEQGLLRPKDFYEHVLPWHEFKTAMELVKNKQTIKAVLKIKADGKEQPAWTANGSNI
ncbi:MAG: zinc-binding dehydrogenase [Clostridiales Family XIII bacterium]|nr:zinc-binding dehydrogenase [Clostridiales Family XIII bacterium]